MSKLDNGRNEACSNALWGRGGRRPRDSRTNALWGKGGRGSVLVLAFVLALAVPMAGTAKDKDNGGKGAEASVYVPSSLMASAKANPDQLFKVVVLGAKGKKGSDVGGVVQSVSSSGKGGKGLSKAFKHVPAASAELSGEQILALAAKPKDVMAITLDAPVRSSDLSGPVTSTVTATTSTTTATPAAPQYSLPPENGETWRDSTRISELWANAPQAPAIAIVDSGIDPTRTDIFGDRIVANVNVSSLTPGVTNDEQGHGTMVAGLAAGNSAEYPGVARNAPIVNIRVADSHGQSIVSDVIAAADWILANKDQYNIRVANFSLRGTVQTSFRFDPLNAALRQLWFNGIVVVAAGGNHGSAGSEVDMSYAPGNDPFIISVGAADEHQNTDPLDNTVAPWSAYGYQVDGFFKPDMSAPGRYLIMPTPESSTLWAQFPDRHVAPGYMWMSGTSFAAPIVAGAAAQILAAYPDYSADDVKGVLMLGANYIGGSGIAGGVGQIDAAYSASFGLPAGMLNPNENFYGYVDPVTGATLEFVKTDAVTGQRYLDEASWASHVATDASWASASWASASWASASWASSNYASASWASASWASNVGSALATEVSGAESTIAEHTKVR